MEDTAIGHRGSEASPRRVLITLQTGMGLGLIGAKELMNQCEARTEIGKASPRRVPQSMITNRPLIQTNDS